MHSLQIFAATDCTGWEASFHGRGFGKVWDFVNHESSRTDYNTSVNLTDDGKKALLELSRGDMRRALNVLQACHAAYEIIGETEIYNCTGNPHPADIKTVVNSMLSDDFTTSYQSAYLCIQTNKLTWTNYSDI